MSWKASAYVCEVIAREHPWLTITHLAVLYALAARHHQDDHCAWGQLSRIQRDTHASESTISHVLAELEEAGIISVWEGQMPRRKGDPLDKRKTRGLFYCFVGLDPEDGPAYEDVVRHVRRGGATTHATEAANSVANAATENGAESAESVASLPPCVATDRPDELQRSGETELQTASPPTPPVRPDVRPDSGPAYLRTGPAPPIVPPASGWGRSTGVNRKPADRAGPGRTCEACEAALADDHPPGLRVCLPCARGVPAARVRAP